MPRLIRYHPPGALVHMISSFAFGEQALDLPGARAKYLALASRAAQNTDWLPLAFGLMGTHPHWALIAGHMPPRSFYHSINTGFGLWVNQQRRAAQPGSVGRTVGHVFAGRPSTYSIAPQDAPRLLAYLHNNPVAAGAVSDASMSQWTSHRAYLQLDDRPSWLEVRRGLALCGLDDTARARRVFHELVCSMASDTAGWIPGDVDAKAARRQLRAETNAPASIGSPTISCEPLEWNFPALLDPHLPVRARWPGSTRQVLGRVAIATRISMHQICSRNRARDVCRARRIVVFVWTDLLNRSLKEIAQALGISSAAASKHLRRCRRSAGDRVISERVARHCWSKLPSNNKTLRTKRELIKLTS